MAEKADVVLPRYVLDTSALLAYIEDEEGSDVLESLLEQAERQEAILLSSFITFTEVFYITLREQGEEVARERLELLNQLPLIRIESSPAIGLAAGSLKAIYQVSLADCWVAALAELYEAKLVHKDPEFEVLAERIELLPLPYKEKKP
jgi:predicted nucleic acid-binding protein